MSGRNKQESSPLKTGADLATHIAAIFSNPETPEILHNAVVDAVNELALDAQINLDHPEVLRVALPLILERLSKRAKKGARAR